MTTELPLAETPAAELAGDKRPAGCKSPSVIGMQLAGWSVVACFFLPLCLNCSGAVVRPVDAVTDAASNSLTTGEVVHLVTLLGAYGNGALVATLLGLSAYFSSRALWWRAFVWQYAASMTLGTAIVALILFSGQETPKDRLGGALAFIPPLVASAAWVTRAIRRGQHEVAWARLQHTWTIVALFYLHLLCLFSQGLLFGYWLTLIALSGMLVSVELARLRMRHDLWDASQRIPKPQFRLRSVFLWMTIAPLVLAYYRSIDPLTQWLFSD